VLLPHAHTVPSAATAYEEPGRSLLADTTVKDVPAGSVGETKVRELVVVPSPRSPSELVPAVHTLPALSKNILCCCPAAIEANRSVPFGIVVAVPPAVGPWSGATVKAAADDTPASPNKAASTPPATTRLSMACLHFGSAVRPRCDRRRSERSIEPTSGFGEVLDVDRRAESIGGIHFLDSGERSDGA
jgi:hypothetical protein